MTSSKAMGIAAALAVLLVSPTLASAKFYQGNGANECGEISCSANILFFGWNKRLIVDTVSCTIQVNGTQGMHKVTLFADDTHNDYFYPEPINKSGDVRAFAFNVPTTFVVTGPDSASGPAVGVGVHAASNGDPISSLTCRVAGNLSTTD